MPVLQTRKKWFNMMKSGERKEDYRKINIDYTMMFEQIYGKYWVLHRIDFDTTLPEKEVVFRCGYFKKAKLMRAICTLTKGYGKPEWGAKPDEKYYILHIKKILDEQEVKDE